LKSAGTAKNQGFDISKCKSRGGGYRVSYRSPLICPVEHAYAGVTYVKLKDTRQSLGTNGEEEYNILKFSAYYETSSLHVKWPLFLSDFNGT